MTAPPDHIVVQHGKLTVNVPRDLFRGDEAAEVPEKVKQFRALMKSRYPWLTENGLDVLMREAKKIMISTMDEESHGRSTARTMAFQKNIDGAIRHMLRWAEREPQDPDVWYFLGELYFKAGRNEEGYKAMNHGRSLI